jgi:hypothetical protein
MGWGYYLGHGIEPYTPASMLPLNGQNYYLVFEGITGASRHQALAILYPNGVLPKDEPIGYPYPMKDPFSGSTAQGVGLILRELIEKNYGLGLSLFRYRFPDFTLEIMLTQRDSEGLSSEGMYTILSGSGPDSIYDQMKLSGDPFAPNRRILSGFDIRYIHFLEELRSNGKSWNKEIEINIPEELRIACMRYSNFLKANGRGNRAQPNAFFIEPSK